MRSTSKDTVRLEGTIESALELRAAALEARDLVSNVEHRDALTALAVHLSYELDDLGVDVNVVDG